MKEEEEHKNKKRYKKKTIDKRCVIICLFI